MTAVDIHSVHSAQYKVPGSAVRKFKFWWSWGNGGDDTDFFDVTISPTPHTGVPTMKPLIEVTREWSPEVIGNRVQHVLSLTLQNDNDFDVTFKANHVR